MKQFSILPFCVLILVALVSCGNPVPEYDSRPDNIQPEESTSESKRDLAVRVALEDVKVADGQILERPSDRLEQSMSTLLSSKGKALNTVNSDGSIYVVAAASTAVPAGRGGFIASRNVAFGKAELIAKRKILSLAGEIITNERSMKQFLDAGVGEDPMLKEKASWLEKTGRLVSQSLDRALLNMGVSENEVASMNQGAKETMFEERYSNYVSSYVASMLRGISSVKIVEGENGGNDYQVAVCLKYSPKQHALSNNLQSLGANEAVIGSETLQSFLATEAADLIPKLGAGFFKDEAGNSFVLGFGQAGVRKTTARQSAFEEMAKGKSRLVALDNIKNLLAEDIVGKEISENVEMVYELKNGESGLYTSDKYLMLVESRRSSVALNSMPLRNWKAVHPVTGDLVVGTVVLLTEAQTVDFGNSEKGLQDEQSIKSFEGIGEGEFIESAEFGGEDI